MGRILTEATPVGSGETAVAPVLALDGVHKRYGRIRALDGVTLQVLPGRIVGLLGPNGSGKSTLLKIAAGLVRPDRGQVRVAGRPPGRATRAQIAYLPELDHLYGWMTGRELIAFLSQFYADWDGEKAERLIDVLGVPVEGRIDKLSKGQRARLKLVTALARRAPLILLDEPLSGIDPPSRERIVQAIVGEFHGGEQSIVVSTHQVRETEGAFDEAIFMNGGAVALAGAADELRERHGCSLEQLFAEVCQ